MDTGKCHARRDTGISEFLRPDHRDDEGSINQGFAWRTGGIRPVAERFMRLVPYGVRILPYLEKWVNRGKINAAKMARQKTTAKSTKFACA